MFIKTIKVPLYCIDIFRLLCGHVKLCMLGKLLYSCLGSPLSTVPARTQRISCRHTMAGLGHNIEYPGWWRADTRDLCFIVTRWHSYKCSRVSHDRKLHVWTDPVPQCATICTQYLHNIYTLPWYLLSIIRYTDWCVVTRAAVPPRLSSHLGAEAEQCLHV